MADLKISQLTGATTPLAGTEVLPIVQSSSTKKVAVSDLTAGRDVATAALTSTKTSAGAVVDVATIQNANSTAGTEAALFFAPTSATGNIRGARISAVNDGNNIISLKVYTGTGATITAKYEFTDDGNLKQLVANKGVNFTANTPAAGMTSQLLNWYEEGTWTAVLSDGTNNATMVANTQSYTRIGRMVTLTGYIQTSSLGSVTGNLRITGLPFAAGFHASGPVGLGLNLNITANQAMGLFIDGGANYIVPTLWNAATGTSTMQASEWSSDGFIAFSFSYAV